MRTCDLLLHSTAAVHSPLSLHVQSFSLQWGPDPGQGKELGSAHPCPTALQGGEEHLWDPGRERERCEFRSNRVVAGCTHHAWREDEDERHLAC